MSIPVDLSLFPISSQLDPAGRLMIGTQYIDSLVEKFGTPLYIYDAQTIEHQVNTLMALLDKHYTGQKMIAYAGKAYFSQAIAQKLAALHLGIDVVSLNEMKVAEMAGFSHESIHLHGNNKSIDELQTALDWGIQAVVVDNLEELSILEEMCNRSHKRLKIWLRITPDLEVATHPHIHTSHADSKFGLHIRNGEASVAIRQALSCKWLDLTGIHTHLGSQIFDPHPYREAIGILYRLAEQEGFIPQEISPGGGWGVRYVEEQAQDGAEPWVMNVCEIIREKCSRLNWPLPKLVLEPGRWIVARAGVACYQVGSQKRTPDGTCILAVDGGLADNPRVALYQSKYTARILNRFDQQPVSEKRVVGKFCESGDVLINKVWLPDVNRGEVLVLPVSGAYQLSMASNYNLANRPAVLWLKDGRVDILQQRESLDQWGWWVARS